MDEGVKKHKQQLYKTLGYFFVITLLTLAYNDCGLVRPPTAGNTDLTSTAFDHTGIKTDCSGCHATGASFAAFPHIHIPLEPGTNCSPCHHDTTKWLNLTASPHTVGATQPTTCSSCHSYEVPLATVPNTADGFTHSSTYGTECATCHTQVSVNVGVTFNPGYFDHLGNDPSALGTCSPCHDTKHHNAGQLCTMCHSPIYPSPSFTGFFGGMWDIP